MKRKRSSIVIALAIVLCLAIFVAQREPESRAQTQTPAAPSADVEALREQIGNFFENMSDPNKGVSKALEDFVKNSSLADNEKTKTRIADGLKAIHQNFGAYVAYEAIGVKNLGNDLVVFRYLYKCQDYPVVWYFTYYRPHASTSEPAASQTSWNLIGFRYDTNLDAALLDATFGNDFKK